MQLANFVYNSYNYLVFNIVNYFNECASRTNNTKSDYSLFYLAKNKKSLINPIKTHVFSFVVRD